jgi:hypothetical protein
MDWNRPHFLNTLVTPEMREKTDMKYQLKQLENRLKNCLEGSTCSTFIDDVHALCVNLEQKYASYISLLTAEYPISFSNLPHYVEVLENQLYNKAIEQALKPKIGREQLLQGILTDFANGFQKLIQAQINNEQLKQIYKNQKQQDIDQLYNMKRACKFWFNPNRLIDTVMVLQQSLVKESLSEEDKLATFFEALMVLYSRLSIKERSNLYGYVASKEMYSLLYMLYNIIEGNSLEWLPKMTPYEINAVARVFHALKCMLDALRNTLKIKQAVPNGYLPNRVKDSMQVKTYSREVVFRIITLYGAKPLHLNNAVEELFDVIEKAHAH